MSLEPFLDVELTAITAKCKEFHERNFHLTKQLRNAQQSMIL